MLGKLKQQLEKRQENDFSDIYKVRTQQYAVTEYQEAKAWGKRDNIFEVGKALSEMQYHEGKRVSSSRQQVEILFGWMKECQDRRTRRIGKHWVQVSLVPRKTVLEQWELWKELKNDPFITEEDFKSKIWYTNFDKLSEEAILKLHETVEKRYENIEDKEVYALYFKNGKKYVPSMKQTEWDVITYIDALEEGYSEEELDYMHFFEKATEAQREQMLRDENIEIKLVRMQKQKTEEVFCSIFLTYRFAMRSMKKYTEDRERQYLLMNPVYVKPKEKGRRITERITEYHTLFADVDFYSKHALPEYRTMKAHHIEKLIIEKLESANFPKQTLTLKGGNGIQLIWTHGPIPQYMSEEWRFMMRYIHELLAEFGADPNAMDDVRILRAVGSIHEKTGKKVTATYYTKDRFDFKEAFDMHCAFGWRQYLQEKEEKRKKELLQREKQVQKLVERNRIIKDWMVQEGYLDENYEKTDLYDKTKKKKRFQLKQEQVAENKWNLRHANIIAGVYLLNDIRKGDMEGHRTFSCFLVRYLTLCVNGGDDKAAIEEMRKLYDSFLWNEYSFDKMIEETNSAKLGFKRWSKNENKGYNYYTSTLIDKLKINDEEMKEMRYIVTEERSKELKRQYDKDYQERKRKEKGMIAQKDTRKEIRNAIKENPEMNKSQITRLVKAKLGKCSRNTVREIFEEMGKN